MFLRKNKGFLVILQAMQKWSTKEVRENEGGWKESIREGKVQGKKVEKENGECTCNLTVMKGTPRKECNKTKVNTFWREGAEEGKRKKRKKKERSWISSPLPENAPSSSQSVRPPWNEKAKQTCSPRLYLVNHQHYKPVLQALWGRKEGERDRKGEKRLAQKILTGKRRALKKQQRLRE